MSSYSLFASGAAPVVHHPTSPHAPGPMASHMSSSSSLAAALDDPLWSTPRLGDFHPSSPTMYRAPPTLSMPYGLAMHASAPSPTSTGSSASSDSSYDHPYDGVPTEAHEYEAYHGSTQSSQAYSQSDAFFSSPTTGFANDGVFVSNWMETSPGSPGKRMSEYTYGVRSFGSFSSYPGGVPSIGRRPSQLVLAPSSPTRPHVKLESPTLSALPLGMPMAEYDGGLGGWGGYGVRDHGMLYYAHPFVHHAPVYAQPPAEEQVCDPRSAFVSPAAQDPVSEAALMQAPSPGAPLAGDGLVDADAEGDPDNEELAALLPSPVLPAQYAPAPAIRLRAADEDGDEGMSEASEPEDDAYVFEEDDGSEYDDAADGDYGARAARKRRAPTRRAGRTSGSPVQMDGYAAPEGPVDESFYAPVGQPARRARGKVVVSTTPLPTPVPNLTKKSRGRRVPTSSNLIVKGGVTKSARAYRCHIDGCGKCFARGEHLKRHVRSIHTNEKPHVCPHPGCDKAFSRHDNLGQHMRVHKDYSSKRRD